ncbi:DUF2783 domain-containing protein [Noviherbaspirillum sp. Root189]|uniref:DUF2783 domain-containing protein n=1 Tax=Noviherbaspirillum sp. Root189 TaxID=1736487 RepID=UPI0009E8D537|nr:DUF2783 domain-containing protein [Noviherbaspirillum sp. Root189]
MNTHPNIIDPDTFYATLVAANEQLTLEQSAELAMRLVFLLANQIGDPQTLANCIDIARKPFTQSHGEPQ